MGLNIFSRIYENMIDFFYKNSDRLIPIIVLIGILIVGYFYLRLKKNQLNIKQQKILLFLEIFYDYIESNGKDFAAYSKLTRQSPMIQDLMGTWGIVNYRPPNVNHSILNFPLIINFLPEIRKIYDDNDLVSLRNQYIESYNESLNRFLGVLENQITNIESELKNPFYSFKSGIQFILGLPFQLITFFDLWPIVDFPYLRLVRKFFLGIINILSFLSIIITILVGWNDAIKHFFEILDYFGFYT
jgi:hypothetical protein